MDLDLPPLYLLPTHMTAAEAQAWRARLPEAPGNLAKVDILVGKSKYMHAHCIGDGYNSWNDSVSNILLCFTTTQLLTR